MKVFRSLFSLVVACSLLFSTVSAALAEIPIPEQPTGGEGGEAERDPITLLKPLQPIQNVLSGSASLIAKGIDNRMLIGEEGFRTPDGVNFGAVDSPLNVGRNAPLLQGAGIGVLVPYRDPAPAFSRSLLVTRDFSERTLQTEPTLAVNPSDPDHVVLGTIDYNFPSNSVYVSIDGGVNWEGPKQTKYLRDDLGSGGDPVLAFDKEGNVYITSISIGVEDYGIGAAGGEALVSSIAVATSNDGGFTWLDPVSTARSKVEPDVTLDPSGRLRGTINFGFLDKPWIATGPHPTIEDQEMIYVTYTEFITRYDILYIGELPVLGIPDVLTTPKLVASSDRGLTWSEPVAVGPTVRSTFGEGESEGGQIGAVGERLLDEIAAPTVVASGDDPGYREEVLQALQERRVRTQQQQPNQMTEGSKRTVQGPVPIVDSKGNVYVAWLDSTDDEAMKGLGELYMAKSEDGGVTFDKPLRIASFLEIPFRPRNAYFRYWASAFPKIAVGPEDELYVVYSALPPQDPYDEGDVFMIRSTNGGTRWSRPQRLNQDESTNAQFFPALDVDDAGTIHVMWGDMRDDPVGTRYHIYYTTSEDQGDTWGFTNEEIDLQVPDTRVTDFPTNPNKAFPSGAFIGDYFSIAATTDEVYMVWADGRLGEFGGINQKIGFARRAAVPSPEIFLSPDTGPGGETITVQGFRFQPDMTYYLQVGGSTVASGRTNDDGLITSSIYVPISGEGAHQVALVDESGNVAATSFYMEFGFDNIQSALKDLDDEVNALRAATPTTVTMDSAAPVASASVESVAYLAEQVQALQQQVEAQQPLAAAPVNVLASGVAGGAAWPWGLALIGGVILGAVFTYLRTKSQS